MSANYWEYAEKVLQFHADASESDTRILQMKFNECLTAMLPDNKALILLVSPYQLKTLHTLTVKVIGGLILEEDIFFDTNYNSLYDTLVNGEHSILSTSELSPFISKQISTMVGHVPEKFLCIPFIPRNPELVRFLCCVIRSEVQCVCTDDVYHAVEYMLRFCGNMISLSLLHDEKARLYRHGVKLLNVAEHLFQKLGDVSGVLKSVMAEGHKLVKAERCSLFLVDREQQILKAKVFEGSEEGPDIKIPIKEGISGHVVATKRMMNVHDAYNEPLFYRALDEISGFKTRNLLSIPILNDGEVIAVAEMCNKVGSESFTQWDEEVCGPFANFCGISIKHTLLYEKVTVAKARQKLTNELMMYHLSQQVSENEKDAIIKCTVDHRNTYRYESFNSSPLSIPEDHSLCTIFEMFETLKLFHEFEIQRERFARFLLYIKKGYRQTPYHNWTHAFSVAHFGYLQITQYRLVEDNYITRLQAMAYLVACLGHDIDHRGTTSSFQSYTGSALASLYSSQGSIMERHHFQQTMCILHMEDCNIFEHLSKNKYSKCIDTINGVILATDLANHFKNVTKIKDVIAVYDKSNEDHEKILLSALVTAADLNMQTKDWSSILLTAKCLYQEFFRQGDLERAMGITPNEMTDRMKPKIPVQQIEFLSSIVIPVFQHLHKMFPKESALLVQCINMNIRCWAAAIEPYGVRIEAGQETIDILGDKQFEEEVALRVQDSQYKEELNKILEGLEVSLYKLE